MTPTELSPSTEQDVAALVARLEELSTPERRKHGSPQDIAMHEAATALSTLAAERGGKVFCAMLSTGVCDQMARAERAEAEIDGLAALNKGYKTRLEASEALATEHLQARFHAEAREHNAHLAVKEERAIALALEAQLARAREALEATRLNAPIVMKALMATGTRNDLLLADIVHKTDDKAREALRSIPAPADGRGDNQMLASASCPQEPIARRVRHKKSGGTYGVLGLARMQAQGWSSGIGDADMAAVVVYRSETDGLMWVRPFAEFQDGRFEDIPASPVGSLGGLEPVIGQVEIDGVWTDISDEHAFNGYVAGGWRARQRAKDYAIKPLEWKFYPQAFPPCWCAQTPFGDCVVEEEAGSDTPTYAARGVRMNVVARTEGLPEAKAAALADLKARIREVLEGSLPNLADATPIEPLTEGRDGVKVNALNWNEYETDGEPDRWDAQTVMGAYYAIEIDFKGYHVSHDCEDLSGFYDTPEAAKAAAQADYEHRIRSALTVPSSTAQTGDA